MEINYKGVTMYRLTNAILLSTLLLFTLNNCSEKKEDNSSEKEVKKERTHRIASWGQTSNWRWLR
jgi:hypothetical protein